MQLTDNEKRDIARYIEANKPLPDKYRFLLFEDKREVELVWNGKTNEVTNTVLPFQVIEQVDEPRSEGDVRRQNTLFDIDNRGRQLQGWTNKLIWGDNKLILSSLKNGPLRKEIEDQGGIKLIYIDPPFDVGADFSVDIEIGDEEYKKEPNVLEELAYRDTWGKGADSFIAMIYERLSLMCDLLADDGSIYVHCDWRVNSYIRLLLDEILGQKNIVNEIIWKYHVGTTPSKGLGKKHDNIYFYKKTDKFIYNLWREPISEERIKDYKYTDEQGRKYRFGGNDDSTIYYLDEGKAATDVWTDINIINKAAKERLDYPTQKPEKLIERIIAESSNEGDLVSDFFCGSGTTLAVAERLGRKWIGADLGKYAVHTARKRLIDVQRKLKKEGKDYRAFEILNLGKYERQHYIGVNPNLREEEKRIALEKKEQDFLTLILSAYKAEKTEGFRTLHGLKGPRPIAVGPINLPISRLFVEAVLEECLEKKITKVDILAFEFEMGLFPNIQEEARDRGIDLVLKYIPRDVFDKRAIEKNQVVFHDVSYIEAECEKKKNTVSVELTDFSVFYNQDSLNEIEENLKAGGKKIVVENGQIVKIEKDKQGNIAKSTLTTKWSDWIDYWAVDFDFESKKEVIRVPKGFEVHDGDASVGASSITGEYEEVWTGDYIFENEWQDFRTKKKRELVLKTPFVELPPGKRKIAVKVVDIFGNDTMKIVEVEI